MENVFELTVEDGDEGVFAISFVAQPAIERDFVYLNKAEIKFAAIDDEKHLVAGPLLVPDKRILRLDTFNQPYEVYFTADTIEKLAQQYLTKKYNDKVTYEHSSDVKDVSLVESWVIANTFKDKSNQYGFSLPKGTWFGIMKVNNPKLWEDVKAGKVKGFSIEGEFEHTEMKNSLGIDLSKNIDDLNDGESEVLLGYIKNLIKKDKRYGRGEKLVEESYSDYGSGVKGNAKRALEWANENGWGSCGTPVGKQRANQLAKGEPISLDTIKRMYSFLSRHEGDLVSSTAYGDGCGKLMYDAWGGKAGLGWSRNKLRELGLVELKEGVPHYTADGKLYEGPTHKDAEGKLMTGETHSEDSEYLYHREDLEALPSIPNSTYPGEKAKKIVSPALIGNDK